MKRKELDRLSRLRESANDSARNFRTVYISYLVIALYIFSIVIFREKELLFRNGSLQIAIVNFSVPIRSFFIVSPMILLALHFNLLIQAVFLSRKVHQYASAIRTIHSLQLRPSSNDEKMEMRDLLFPAPLAHMIAGGDSDSIGKNLLLAVVLFSIMFLPPIILISIEVRFLAYQSKYITIWQSILVAIDVGLLWWLWPRITAPDEKWIQWFQNQWRRWLQNLQHTKIRKVIIIAVIIWGSSCILLYIFEEERVMTERVLVQEKPSPEILSAYLDTCGEKRCDEAAIDPGTPVWCKYARPLDLEERVFRDAYLSGVILCAVDFENAILNDADLSEAKLHGANFIDAELHGANLDEAELHGANLLGAELHGADLYDAKFRGADLRDAELYGAYLFKADLHGADLRKSDLYGANLQEVDLRGADLREAKFYRTNLKNADLRGADLREAKFYGTKLTGVNLAHADLRKIDFSEPNFSELYMQMTKSIDNPMILKKVLDRIENAKDHKILDNEALIALPSNKYSINDLHDFPYFYAYPEEKSIGDKYREKLAAYLVDDLACNDKVNGYVVKGIARRARDDDMLGPQLADYLLKAKCPAVMNTLPERLRADLEKIADLKKITGG